MTKRMIIAVLVAILAGAFELGNAQSILTTQAPLGQDVPQMQVYSADDADYFVLSLPPAPEEMAEKADIVIVCDTSAAMQGTYRDAMMVALDLVVGSLGAQDRVQIVASDLYADPLTSGFAAPGSLDIDNAKAKLAARPPLGSSDIATTLNTALGMFPAASTASGTQREIVYIGQGTSRANLLKPSDFAALADSLAAEQIAVHSVAIGPNVDIVLLKTLAAKTGGVMMDTDSPEFSQMSNVLHRKVRWTKGEPQHTYEAVYPAQTPPLRSDRETLVVGKKAKGAAAGTFTVVFDDGSTLPYSFAEQAISLPSIKDMVDHVEKSKGWLPLETWADVDNVMRNVQGHVDSLLALAEEVANSQAEDKYDQAEALIREAIRKDPRNERAQHQLEVVQGLRDAQRGIAENLSGADAGIALGAFDEAEDVATQSMRVQVQNTINEARQMMGTQPEEAVNILQIELEALREAGLRAEVQDTLTKQLQAAIREAKSRQESNAIRDQEERTRLAEMRERQIALDEAKTERQKIQQMMRRFDSLMAEGRYRDAEEDVAVQVLELDPENTPAVAGMITARHKGYEQRISETNTLRNKGFVDALQQAEIGHVPFPDEPPVVYPDSEVWKRLTEKRVEKYASMDLAQRGQAEKQIMEALKEATQINEQDQPLSEVIERLKQRHNIEIQLDRAALDEEGLDPELEISMNVRGISLGAALRLMLTSQDMMYVIEDEVLKITTQTKASESQSTRVYPVADLVIPIENLPPMNGGMGGGMLGNNNSGGGMGGGMMGGMGMGMGFQNRPAENLIRARAINEAVGGDLFNVPDDVKATPKKESKASKPVKKVSKASPQKWSAYFKSLQDASPEKVAESQVKVRDLVRKLREEKRFSDMIVVIEAALLNNQAQPWMYEALAIAMTMDNRPAQDVERAITSALEFCENPNQMLLIGSYLENLGFADRAFKIYRQLANMFPNDPEPFVFALNLARRAHIDDVEALKWSTVGLLRLEVGEERQSDWQNALASAKALVERLRKSGEAAQADEFAKEMELALRRDCRIIVSWTGEADVDLYVEEPNGSICSLQNQRSAGGGFIAKDGFTKETSRDASSRASETYVCSQGFSGAYRIIAKRVWGEVTGNKVIVEVVIHYGSDAEKRMKYAVPLEKDLAGVEFALDDGRRTESLEEQRLVRVVREAKDTQVAQKLLANIDNKAMASYSLSDSSNYYPYLRDSAVGYMPVIWTLQPGAVLGATGVVSADRRYVRISAAPSFSSIGKVTVFNFTTGDAYDYDSDSGTDSSNNLN
ncbi:MAG: hypothetical protein Q4D38_08330 [Planctomycetia bacterium]|nr:hypothetical protein [Planctomycetia bacterium]